MHIVKGIRMHIVRGFRMHIVKGNDMGGRALRSG